MQTRLVIGTRKSKLALRQTEYVAGLIGIKYPDIEIEIRHMQTTGDRLVGVPLAQIGGKGLFTEELEKALLAGEIDLAVHSLKDMPTHLPAGLTIGAVTERVDAGDALISPRYQTVDNLPAGAIIGTSSLRRGAQLLHYRPDLCVRNLRGNVDTRLNKLDSGEFDAVILAVAGLRRLGWESRITQLIPEEICLPAVGQGALALETRENDRAVLDIIDFLHHGETACAVTAERAYLRAIEGNCQVPVGVYAKTEGKSLLVKACILSPDGQKILKDSIAGDGAAAEKIGHLLARRMLAGGGTEILATVKAAAAAGEEAR